MDNVTNVEGGGGYAYRHVNTMTSLHGIMYVIIGSWRFSGNQNNNLFVYFVLVVVRIVG